MTAELGTKTTKPRNEALYEKPFPRVAKAYIVSLTRTGSSLDVNIEFELRVSFSSRWQSRSEASVAENEAKLILELEVLQEKFCKRNSVD